MKRLIHLMSLAVVTLLLMPGVARADQPMREGLPQADFTIQGSCSFDVDLHIIRNNEFITTFSDGRQLITGALVVSLTNVDTGKAITLNISGPVFFTPHEDGSLTVALNGRSLVFFAAGDLGPGSAGVLELTSGPAVIEFDANGSAVSYTKASAATVDLCAVLADP
jgi:hypothetical protein